ncbi:F-box/kelch-repeat protein-like protein [Tanacetum coccineum]
MMAPPTIPLFKVESNACFFNENLHWVVLTDWGNRIILTFSLTTSIFRTLELPEPITRARQLTIINGSLALISWANNHTWVWLMSQSHNVVSWSALYKYKINDFDRFFQPVLNGDLLTYGTGREVYNTRTQLFTKFLDFGPCHGLEIERHVESLELLDKRATFGKTIFPSTILSNHKRQFSSSGYDDGDDDDDNDEHDDGDVDVDDSAAVLSIPV